MLATDGNLYGAATNGGAVGYGVLYRVTTSGTYTALHDFQGSDGGFPIGAPIEASDGNLYGATFGDQVNNFGTVYKYSRDGTFSNILSFSVDGSKGAAIYAPLIQANDGSLYGTSTEGGVNGCGTIFKLTTSGILLHVYSFPCGSGGSRPVGPIMQASDGNFYGTTAWGGITTGYRCQSSGCGTIFRMTQSGSITVLYEFEGGQTDGHGAIAGLVEGTDGNLYGSTYAGGGHAWGTFFQVTLGGIYTFLYSLPNSIGEEPSSTLLQHTSGVFYGTASWGGWYGRGAVYSFDMGLAPFITFVRPTGKVGQTIQILGQGLTGASSVSVNGVAAITFNVVSDTYMTAVIPTGATTGPVVVTTPIGTRTSNKNFRITQ